MQWVRIGAGLGFLGVVLGAFGAHGLEEKLAAAGRVETWETAAFYHLVHAVMLVVVALGCPGRRGAIPCGAFAAGIVLFSGSLYVLCLSGIEAFGAVTPLGGVAFLVGWAWLVRCGGKG